jgi:hypothetical protein
MDTLKYTKQRIIKALKDAAEKWAVVAAGPINYFSDGSVIVSCEEALGVCTPCRGCTSSPYFID